MLRGYDSIAFNRGGAPSRGWAASGPPLKGALRIHAVAGRPDEQNARRRRPADAASCSKVSGSSWPLRALDDNCRP